MYINKRRRSSGRICVRLLAVAGACVAVVSFGVREVAAQALTRDAATRVIDTFGARGTDKAFDPVNNVYLIVGANQGTGALEAVAVNAAGVPLSNPVVFMAGRNPGTEYPFGSWPHVTYSPAIGTSGGFMVVWQSEEGKSISNLTIYARTVSLQGGAVVAGTQQQVSTTAPGNQGTAGPHAACSTTSHKCLVVWQSGGWPHDRIYGRMITTAGVPLLSHNLLSDPTMWSRDPAVSWNSDNDEFGVSYDVENQASNSDFKTGFARVPATNLDAATFINFNPVGSATTITDIAYDPNTHNYLMVWNYGPPGQTLAMGAEISATGSVLTTGLARNNLGSYDGLAMAFNPLSQTFLLVGEDRARTDGELGTSELNAHGMRNDTIGPTASVTGFCAGSTTDKKNFYPRVAASTTAKDWNIVVSHCLSQIMDQVIHTTTAGGGQAGTLATSSGGSSSGNSGSSTPPPLTCSNNAPVSTWVCVGNNNWVPPDHPSAIALGLGSSSSGSGSGSTGGSNGGSTGGTSGGSTGGSSSGSAGGSGSSAPLTCVTNAPVSTWVCVGNNNWVPPDHPSAIALGLGSSSSGSGSGSTGGSTGGSSGGSSGGSTGGSTGGSGSSAAPTCVTNPPVSNWVCVGNNNWVPPDHPSAIALGLGSGSSGSGSGSTGGSSGGSGSTGGSSSGSTGGSSSPTPRVCSTNAPGPTWVCLGNNNWVPPDHPLALALANGGGL